MARNRTLIFAWLVFYFIPSGYAQKSLRVSFMRFSSPKVREVFVGDRLEYKVKGSSKFRTGIIANLNDSLIVLASEKIIPLSQLKAIRIQKNKYHLKLFQTVFVYGAVGYPLLVSANYFIVPNSQGLNVGTAIISGSFLVAAVIMHELNVHRIRITPRKQLLVLDRNYEHLGDSTQVKW